MNTSTPEQAPPTETSHAIYYKRASTLKSAPNKPGRIFDQTTFIEGIYHPDQQDGVEMSSTFDSNVYQQSTIDTIELQKALNGQREFIEGDNKITYDAIGQIEIDVTHDVEELMKMLHHPDEKQVAIEGIKYIIDVAAKIIADQVRKASIINANEEMLRDIL